MKKEIHKKELKVHIKCDLVKKITRTRIWQTGSISVGDFLALVSRPMKDLAESIKKHCEENNIDVHEYMNNTPLSECSLLKKRYQSVRY